ncbi:MAG: AAA family ATPase [Proteobacteria bacterium]|nr:AAA family ATPase [Pseudomonadota bacterium]
MRIRKLELQGFKSFVDRQTFHFGEGIAGVVGPNGCGKSNIVDAIKWVVGEQSAKSLRGQSMTDVIFNGSEGRKKVGMAEVIMTFGRTEAPFPGDYARFEEIRIGRRLYRDGGSEYLINQVKVRRKDIVDLLLDTGIGNKLYSFIEQGQIGQIVNARPEQRRGLFEEAAGISRFKARKQETESKLEQTMLNLERATDVAEELGRRLRTLERQVEKAAKYRRYRAQIRQGELYLGLARYAALAGDRKALFDKHRSAASDLEELARDVARRDRALSGAREEIAVMTSVVGTLRDAVAELEAQRRQAETEREFQAREQRDLQARLDVVSHDLDESRRAMHASTDEAARTDRELTEARSSLEDRESTHTDHAATARVLGDELRTVERDVESAKREHMKLVTGLVRRRTTLAGSVRRIEEHTRRIDELDNTKATTGDELAALATQQAEAEAQAEQAKRRRDEASEEIKSVAARVKTLEVDQKPLRAAARAAEDALTRAQRTLGALDAKLGALRAMQESRTGVEGSAKDVLDRFDTLGVVAEHIGPAEAERAKRVLGADLDAVVVRDRTQLLEIADALAESPRTGLIEGQPTALLDVLEAATLPDAIALQQKTGRPVLVPDTGARVESNGVIHVGRAEVASGARLLERRAEIDALDAERGSLAAAVESASEAAERAQVAVESSSDELETARARLEERRTAARLLEREFSESRSRARDLERDVRSRQERSTRIAAEIGGIRRRIEQIRTEDEADREAVARDEERQAAAEATLSTLQAGLAELQARVVESREATARARMEQSAVRERVLLLEKAQASALTRRDEATRRVERLDGELAKSGERLTFLAADDERLQERLFDLGEDQDGKRDQLGLERERLKKAREAIAGAEETLRKQRERQTNTQTRVGQLNVKLEQVRARIEGTRQSVDERYKVSLPALLDQLESRQALVLEAGADARAELPVPGLKLEPVQDLRLVPDHLEDQGMVGRWVELLAKLKDRLEKLGEVNLAALEEYGQVAERFQWLDEQRQDLEESVSRIRKTIGELNRTCRDRFREAFDRVNAEFRVIYPRLVGGGQGRLALTDENDLLTSGVEIFVQPPGKRLQNLTLLSGGEKAMCAVGLLFSLFKVKPSPFCLLDEVDAPLDESNGARFNNVLRDMSELTQFIVITHNKKTMEVVDTLYGVTMPDPGISRLVSVQVS